MPESLDEANKVIDNLLKVIELKDIELKKFEVFGTDECPKCIKEDGRAQIGANYNRTTLYYRPSEHELHINKRCEEL